jgi:catechol 2,3-dioxygenase-like lactoylglutathione lyase family enzyme
MVAGFFILSCRKFIFGGETIMGKVNVRYIVDDVDRAIPFYADILGFKLDMHPAPGFASMSRGDLQLLLNRPGAGGAGQTMPDGKSPVPGGWNRIQIEVEDLAATVEKQKRRERASVTKSYRQRRQANLSRRSFGQSDRTVPAVLGRFKPPRPKQPC